MLSVLWLHVECYWSVGVTWFSVNVHSDSASECGGITNEQCW